MASHTDLPAHALSRRERLFPTLSEPDGPNRTIDTAHRLGAPGGATESKGGMAVKRTLWVAAIPTLVLASVVGAFAGGDQACKGTIEDCSKKLAQKYQSAGWLGLETEKGEHGFAVVSRVIEGSPAQAAGFEAGDVLIALDGIKLSDENKEKLHQLKQKLGPGADVTYTVKRKGGKLDLTAHLSTMPESLVAQNIGEHILKSHLQAKVAAK